WVGIALSLAALAILAAESEAAIDCGYVTNALYPCYTYVFTGGTPPADCCNSVRDLKRRAANTADLRTVCSCLQQLAGQASGSMLSNAEKLPGKCGVAIGFPISTATNC
ncbi:non-specific lipid-transfer protein, partial [Genlisea aurea]